jgi:hypothetical protein
MKAANIFVELALFTAAPLGLGATELQSATVRAWDDYIGSVDSRMQLRLNGQLPFLWADEAAGRIPSLENGKTLIAPAAGNGIHGVPDGLIHHWIGAIFIPNVNLQALRAVVNDYDRYKDFYKPVVADSKAMPCSDADRQFSMIWQHRVLFINAAVEGHYRVRDFAVDARHGYYIATTTEMREIEAFGHRNERFLAPGIGNGFIWRLQSIARYEERDRGVFLELEAIALTRDIPTSLHWLVSPLVNHLSINSLTTTLQQTRAAVYFQAGEREIIALHRTDRGPGGGDKPRREQ